jgi:hypothetical protein
MSGMQTLCSRCDEPAAPGQNHCRKCQAAYMRAYRKRQMAEVKRLRSVLRWIAIGQPCTVFLEEHSFVGESLNQIESEC